MVTINHHSEEEDVVISISNTLKIDDILVQTHRRILQITEAEEDISTTYNGQPDQREEDHKARISMEAIQVRFGHHQLHHNIHLMSRTNFQ
jgi:hypothetical protein